MTDEATPYLRVRNLSKRFGHFVALSDVSIEIAEGEFVCFLGPSGCGKTTLLRCIAGLETQSEGSVEQRGEDVSWLPPSARDFGIVFQSYALFPNLSVFDNVGYGLVNKKWRAPQVRARVEELLELVGLADQAKKYPGQLSGGEQQRVALVRALATSPGLLLLDEPLSALDAKVRARLRREIKDLQKILGVTTIMVTHDQEEAQTMADRIFVMKAGEVIQVGTPTDIYSAAATPFIADFIGVMNFIPAQVANARTVLCQRQSIDCDASDHRVGADLNLAIRPEDVILDGIGDATRNILEVTIKEIEFLGSFRRAYLETPDFSEAPLLADIPNRTARRLQITPGQRMRVHLPPEDIRLYEIAGS